MVERSDTTGSWSPKNPTHPGRDASAVACIVSAFVMAGGDGVDEMRWVVAWDGVVRIVGIYGLASRLGVLARPFPPRSGTPAGVRVVRGAMGSGGVASLNHRLHPCIPPGCVRGAGPVSIAGRRKMVERGTSMAG